MLKLLVPTERVRSILFWCLLWLMPRVSCNHIVIPNAGVHGVHASFLSFHSCFALFLFFIVSLFFWLPQRHGTYRRSPLSSCFHVFFLIAALRHIFVDWAQGSTRAGDSRVLTVNRPYIDLARHDATPCTNGGLGGEGDASNGLPHWLLWDPPKSWRLPALQMQ